MVIRILMADNVVCMVMMDLVHLHPQKNWLLLLVSLKQLTTTIPVTVVVKFKNWIAFSWLQVKQNLIGSWPTIKSREMVPATNWCASKMVAMDKSKKIRVHSRTRTKVIIMKPIIKDKNAGDCSKCSSRSIKLWKILLDDGLI